jgi:AraC-like DNA-binding protein
VNVINHQQAAQEAAQEAERLAANRKELVERIGRALPEDGIAQPLPGVNLCRFSSPLGPNYVGITPCVCVIAQGSKQVLLGKNLYRYDSLHYLLTTIGLPSVPQVLEASKERPHLSLSLYLAPTLVNSVLLEIGPAQPPEPADVSAIAVSAVDGYLLEACVRLMRLPETPADAPILQPLIMREMVYRLLKGEQGARLSQLAIPGSYTASIARAVERLRQDFNQPLRIEELARELGMSVSGLRKHFKAVTAMSPSQFQKQLRLQEARHLLLDENLDAASAASQVGYQDASHFNREYKSLFGVSPMRDVQHLREEMQDSASR